MGEGAAEAIAAAGRGGKVVIGSFDVQAPTVKALKEGKLAFTGGVRVSMNKRIGLWRPV